uniref:Uncharacterized protein n=1 Tax=Anguilla anguilla TaxID=7936 RepID=A0A0E9VKF6_ANGAN
MCYKKNHVIPSAFQQIVLTALHKQCQICLFYHKTVLGFT